MTQSFYILVNTIKAKWNEQIPLLKIIKLIEPWKTIMKMIKGTTKARNRFVSREFVTYFYELFMYIYIDSYGSDRERAIL